MKYIQYFESQNAYNDVSVNLPDPTIALYENDNDNNVIIYKDDNKYLIVSYNITDISEPTTLFSVATNTSVTTFVYSIEIDGEQQELTTSTNFTFDYQFNTAGMHLVKIYLKPTWQGNVLGVSFRNYTNVITVRIPKQIDRMQSNFYKCTSLTNVIIDKGSMLPDTGSQTFEGCTSLKNINLSNASHVTTIPTNCFYNTALEELNIPDNVTTISNAAFNKCSSLKRVYASLNSKLSVIERNVFSSCSNLEYIHLPNTITSIGNDAFNNCQKLEGTIDLKNCTTVAGSAFRYCSKLQFKNINKVSSIGVYAFASTSLTSVEIKENASLGIHAFSDCPNLETIIFDGDIQMENMNYPLAKDCSKLTNVIFKKTVTKLPANAFQGAFAMTSIDLSNVLELSDGGIGNQFKNMTSVIFNPNITRIPVQMFSYWNNTNLTVTIPASVTEIASEAFAGGCRGTFYILATTPPTLTETSRINNNMTIYVPVESLQAYKTAEYWSDVADRIFAIPS